MTKYAIADVVPEKRQHYLTAGKPYKINDNLELRDDVGDVIIICVHDSAHLDGGDWRIVDADHEDVVAWNMKIANEEGQPKSTAPITTENPKDAVGSAKASISNIPAGVIAELGVAMMEGARKYGRHNYRAAGIRASVYYDAVMRHMMAWWEGEDIDPDSGLSHITKAIATLTVLRDCQMNGRVTDDRPPSMDSGWLAELNAKAAALVEKYPTPRDAVTKS